MKIECLLEKINTRVQYVAKIAGRSSTLPALQGVYIEAKNGAVICTATNLELGIETRCTAKVEEEGSVLVSADMISKILSNIDQGEKNIHIETKRSTVGITTQKNTISVNTLPREEFPSLPQVEGVSITVPKKVIIDGIRSVFFAAAHSDIKPEIASIYIYSDVGEMVFVATDAFRLAEKRIKTKTQEQIQVLLPYKNITDILRVLDYMEEEVTLTYSETMLSLRDSSIYLTSRVTDGMFPDYKRIIPQETLTEVVVLKQDITNSLKLTSIFSDTFNQITFKTEKENNQIVIHTNNQQIGESNHTIHAKITGEDIESNFNHTFLQDVLPVLQKESMTYSFTTKNKAMVVRASGDTSFLYLIMPLNR